MQIGKDVSFNLNVKAVQSKNNPDRSLELGFQDETNTAKNKFQTADSIYYDANDSYGPCPENLRTSKLRINANEKKKAANSIELKSNNPNENNPFKIGNMFPGDSTTQCYRIRTTCDSSAKVNLSFGNIDTNNELTNIVKTRIKLLPETELYDGLLRDMSTLTVPTTSGTNEMNFEITLYIDASIKDIKYENQSLSFNILFNIQDDTEFQQQLMYKSITIENNVIHTGDVKINLNDGKPVIREHEFLICWHGFRIDKNFFVKNEGTWDCYYKLYLTNIEGELAKFMNITVKDGEKILWKGLMSEFNEENSIMFDDVLKIGQKRDLTIEFEFIGFLK